MLVDSHCHLDFPELRDAVDDVIALMAENEVTHALCVSVTLQDFPRVRELAERHQNLYASVGVHPDHADVPDMSVDEIVRLANHEKVVAIGETGLDYHRATGDLTWQRERFRLHIRAAREAGKPLIVHTREAPGDTLQILREEGAREVGGVMHCFTESWDVAAAAIELGFMISFSGIVTFKNAEAVRSVASRVPADALLVETDAPYLAPVPYRGKVNQPGFVKYVAAEVARVRGVPFATIAAATTRNFFRLFSDAARSKTS